MNTQKLETPCLHLNGDMAGHVLPGKATRPMNPDVMASVPAGVHSDSMSQMMAAMPNSMTTPMGQTINVVMNAPSPHLSFKEWMARGMVGGVGKVAAFPFRLVGVVMEGTANAVVTIVKMAIIIILVPTLLMLGIALHQRLSSNGSVEAGAADMMHQGRHAVSGMAKGLTDDLPPEEKTKEPSRPDRP